MGKLVFQIAIAIFYLGISSCGNSAEDTTSETTRTTTPTSTESTTPAQTIPNKNQASEIKETDIYKNTDKQKQKSNKNSNIAIAIQVRT